MQNTPPLSPSSVSLSDFAANPDGVLSLRQWTSFVWELMLYSLLRDEVLIQDEALVLSEKFARIFATPVHVRMLDELFDMGTLVVLKHPLTAYPEPGLQELALTSPLVARARYIQQYTTKGAQPFLPTAAQRRVHENLDGILQRHPASQREAGHGSTAYIFKSFSNKLSEILGDSRYRPWLLAEFPGTTHAILDDFEGYVADPQRALRRIAEAGREVRPGPESAFTRSIGYQVAETYSPRQAHAMQHFLQSAFAVAFNSRENAIGRYSASLREVMIMPPISEPERDPTVVTIDAVVRTPLRLPAPAPGFAKVIQEVRGTDAGKRLRNVIRSRSTTAFEEQQDAWNAVAHELASRTSKFRAVEIVSAVAAMPRAIATAVIVEGIYSPHSLLDPTFWQDLGVTKMIGTGINVSGDLLRHVTARWYTHRRSRQTLEDAVYFRSVDDTPYADRISDKRKAAKSSS